jgi:predicted RNase H-like nuclease (RuvC/YqgF family)
MKAKVAVVTVSGKEYFLIVCELKKENLPFLSLVPGQIIPAEAKVVITTEKESSLIDHERILVFGKDSDIAEIVRDAKRIVEGKEIFEHIAIGIDPGQVLGVAVVADGKVIETTDCFSIREASEYVKRAIKGVNFQLH